MANELVHPPVDSRRKAVQTLRNEVHQLGRATTLADVAVRLLSLQNGIITMAHLHGIDLAVLGGPMSKRDLKKALNATHNGLSLNAPLPGRAPYNSIKEAILEFAQGKASFTVDELMKEPRFRNKSRRNVVANLLCLSRRGEKPLRQIKPGKMGRRGSPAVYTLSAR